MEKILLALDANHQNTYAVDFACYMAKLAHSRLIGVFLEGENDGTGTRPMLREPITVDDYVGETTTADAVSVAVRRFRESCVCREVPARVHRDRGVPLKELQEESRFADLVILDPEMHFDGGRVPAGFIEQALHAAECPAIVAPYSFNAIDAVYFTYDGSASSVYAIRQFTYLFPELRQKKTVVISVSSGKKGSIPDHARIKEWMSAHYQAPEFVVLNGLASDALFGFFLEKKDAIVVLGAYGRGPLSRAFQPSHAQLLLKAINLPVFIAHR